MGLGFLTWGCGGLGHGSTRARRRICRWSTVWIHAGFPVMTSRRSNAVNRNCRTGPITFEEEACHDPTRIPWDRDPKIPRVVLVWIAWMLILYPRRAFMLVNIWCWVFSWFSSEAKIRWMVLFGCLLDGRSAALPPISAVFRTALVSAEVQWWSFGKVEGPCWVTIPNAFWLSP